MNAVAKPQVPHIRPMRTDDLREVLAIEVRAYPYPWTEGVFRDCLKSGHS